MKKTRRGGLGRGLGALIQSTADTEETTQSPSASAPADSGKAHDAATAPSKSTTPRRRTTSAAAAASEEAADKTPSTASQKSSGSAAGKTAGSASGKTPAKTSSKTAAAKTSSTANGAKTKASSGTSSNSGDSSSSPTKKTSGASSKSTQPKKGTGTTSAKTSVSTSSRSTAKSAGAAKTSSSGRRSGRPVDVFFSSDGTPEASASSSKDASESTEQEKSAQTAPAARRGSGTGKQAARRARPSMPTVSAPSRRSTAQSVAAEKAAQTPAVAPTEAKEATPKAAATGASARTSTETSAPVTSTEEQAATVSTDIAVLRELKVTDIHPNPRQPREVFDEDHMHELVTSITEVGILQPVVVREVDGPTPYELIMGERRWRATQLAGLETIPAIVRHTPDEDLLRDALLENLHRSQLNPLEEAAAYQQLMDDFQCTQEELSLRIGRSRPQISNTLRLMKLPPLVQRRVANNVLTAGHARALLGLTDPAEMERLAQRIVSEGLSVRATEEAVALAQGVRQAAPATRRNSEPTRHERLDNFATALTSRLDTQVKITLGKRKGKIAIDFTSVEDLNRIMGLIQGDDEQK